MKSVSKKVSTPVLSLAEELSREAALLAVTSFEPAVPLPAFLKEAAVAAAYLRRHWEPRDGVPTGLCRAEKKLPLRTADEIDQLLALVKESNREAAIMAVTLEQTTAARARSVLREVRLALEYFVDDDKLDENDDKVKALAALHATEPSSIAKLSHALGDYAQVASELRSSLDDVPDFDTALIDEGLELANAILVKSLSDTRDGLVTARVARARYLAMIDDRVARIRRVARYVFRAHPTLVREVTSAHARDQRRAVRQRRTEPLPEPLPAPEPAPAPSPDRGPSE